jgi:cation transport regulator ChaC
MIDTSNENKDRQDLTQFDEIWLFGYGSLIYKVDFPYIAKCAASIQGWQRRFWQGSHDHRGTPDNPGRVVTLINVDKQSGALADNQACVGMAYQVTAEVFEHLDHREKNGYLRHQISIDLENGIQKQGLIYIADEANSAFLGDASAYTIAHQIFNSRGPSGENKDYLLELASSLRSLKAEDDHVFEIERHIHGLIKTASEVPV